MLLFSLMNTIIFGNVRRRMEQKDFRRKYLLHRENVPRIYKDFIYPNLEGVAAKAVHTSRKYQVRAICRL